MKERSFTGLFCVLGRHLDRMPSRRQTLRRVRRYTPYSTADNAVITAPQAAMPANSPGVKRLSLKYMIIR